MIGFLFFLPFIILFPWIIAFLFITDFSLSQKRKQQYKRVLAIFPHADDETISCGGFLHHLSTHGSAVTLVILTKGEKGTEDAAYNARLKDIRTQEAQKAAAILSISRVIQADFGDGELYQQKQELTAYITTIIEQEQPELLITYDLAGFYGHSDHIVCSEIVTQLRQTARRNTLLWYVTFPRRILALVKLPEHIAGDTTFKRKQALPTHKIYIGKSVFQRIKAWYVYKSQHASFKQGFAKCIPLWFFPSLFLFEYFAEVSLNDE